MKLQSDSRLWHHHVAIRRLCLTFDYVLTIKELKFIAEAEETATVADVEVQKINVEILELEKRLVLLQSQRNKYLIDVK